MSLIRQPQALWKQRIIYFSNELRLRNSPIVKLLILTSFRKLHQDTTIRWTRIEDSNEIYHPCWPCTVAYLGLSWGGVTYLQRHHVDTEIQLSDQRERYKFSRYDISLKVEIKRQYQVKNRSAKGGRVTWPTSPTLKYATRRVCIQQNVIGRLGTWLNFVLCNFGHCKLM